MMERLDTEKKDIYKGSRLCYILEAAVEYFISILVGTTYLAKLTSSIGISDGVTGILSSFISLGCGFQILALLLSGGGSKKRLITGMTLIHQLLFTFLYVVPLFDLSKNTKTVIFVVLLVLAYFLKNLVFAPKTAWMMSLVDDSFRGRFTAKKEIVSLISGMVVQIVMGRVIDTFEERGNLQSAFIVSTAVLLVFTVAHVMLLILTKEKKEVESIATISVKEQLKSAITDKNLHALIPLYILWNVANYITTPFYGTYQLKDLGFSMTFVAVLSIIYALVRSLVSPMFGKLADKRSFATMLKICFGIKIFAFVFNMIAGQVFYTVYYILSAIALAGINGGMLNIIYDYIPHTRRTGALAICNSISGVLGFFATLAAKPLVDYIQSQGNKFLFFEHIYAQQLLSFLAAVIIFVIILYLHFVVSKLCKPSANPVSDNAI
ncbi:MAG: MFS transporter [Clostridia bacterium]|nr:MFS transporter [Clostridia bacterium]